MKDLVPFEGLVNAAISEALSLGSYDSLTISTLNI